MEQIEQFYYHAYGIGVTQSPEALALIQEWGESIECPSMIFQFFADKKTPKF